MNTGPYEAFVQHGDCQLDDYIVRGANNAVVVEGLETLGEAKMWARRLNDAYAAGFLNPKANERAIEDAFEDGYDKGWEAGMDRAREALL